MKWHKLIPAALLTVVLTTGLLTACAKVEADSPSGILIPHVSYGIGNVDGDPDKPVKITYTIMIQNKTKGDVFINSATPVLSGSVNDLVLNPPDDFNVNTTLAPESYIEVNGELIIDSAYNNTSKKEIDLFKITSVEIKSTLIIDLPAQG